MPVAVAAVVGVAAAVGAVVVVTGGGDEPPPAAESTTIAAAPVATDETTAPGAASTTAPKGARGVTGATAIVAGLPRDNSGNGVPGDATAVSLGAPSYLVVARAGDIFMIDSAGPRVLRIKDGKATVAFEGSRALGGMAVSPAGKVVVLTDKGLVEITGDGQSTPIATLAELGDGVGPGNLTPLAFDGAGNLYIGNNNRNQVLRRSAEGTMSLVAGNGKFAAPGAPQGDGGPATAAPLPAMGALVVDGKGNLLIGETLGNLRKVSTDGTISTIGGAGETDLATATTTFVPDGTKALDVDFAGIDAMVIDAKGRLYIGDSQSGAIVRIISDGTIEFIAGDQAGVVEPETKPRPANQTRVADADGMAFDASGALIVVEAGVILRIESVATS